MKKYSLAAMVGGAIISVVSASASPTSFDFMSGVTGNSVTANGITVNMVGFDMVGTSAGPTGHFTAAPATFYSGAGMGVCETGAGLPGNDCASPNHQINNGTDVNTNSGGQVGSTYYYEFMLMQFTGALPGASVNLSSMSLGNFGTNGTTGNPFGATYWVSNSNDTLAQMEAALAGTTAGSLAGTNGFGVENQTNCVTGCGINTNGDLDAVSGNNVTYLLFGASLSTQGADFFKLQGLNIAGYSTGSVSATPEPATFGLIGLALAGLGVYGRRRKSRS